ncbi:MAG TPA: hypothetical protein VFR15_04430 [Chloroflexia bacterium]|nr:hypothetical protein [Chloroflexia bacterium]
MGTVMMGYSEQKQTSMRRRALMVELVGSASAGKTTLTNSLTQRSAYIRVAADISVRKVRHLAVFARTIPMLLPVLLPRRPKSRWLTWDEVKSIVYLKAWPRVLTQQVQISSGAILLDQGPVFRLATLHAFGPDILRRPAAKAWWDEMFEQWAPVLDLVICLDAPNPILQQRINSRDRWHPVQAKPEPKIAQFLNRYRASYRYVLRRLSSNDGPTVIAFDTSTITTGELASLAISICLNHSLPENNERLAVRNRTNLVDRTALVGDRT